MLMKPIATALKSFQGETGNQVRAGHIAYVTFNYHDQEKN